MNHEEIDQYDIIDRYLLGKLPVEESTKFEEHFIDCPQCISQLQMTDRFIQGLRTVAVEQTLPAGRRQPRSAFVYSLYDLFRRPWALAWACLLIAAAIGAIWAIHDTRRLRAEADQARSLAEQWQRRYESEQESAEVAGKKLQETERQRAEQMQALEKQLKEEQEQRTKMAMASSRRVHSSDNVHVFVLDAVRSSAASTAKPVSLPRSATEFALSISVAGETSFRNYRITIRDDRHRLIETRRRLTPTRDGDLTILLNADRFRAGDYSLVLEGYKKEGGQEVVDYYPFRINFYSTALP